MTSKKKKEKKMDAMQEIGARWKELREEIVAMGLTPLRVDVNTNSENPAFRITCDHEMDGLKADPEGSILFHEQIVIEVPMCLVRGNAIPLTAREGMIRARFPIGRTSGLETTVREAPDAVRYEREPRELDDD